MGFTVVIGTKHSVRVGRMQRANSSHGMTVDMWGRNADRDKLSAGLSMCLSKGIFVQG